MDNTITVTCVSCGRKENVQNTPEMLRNKTCPACGSAMVLKRRPGDVSNMPLPTAG